MKRKELDIKLLVGIPASGKSTWKKEFLKKNPNYVSVSRDDFRFMLRNEPLLENKGESMVTDLVHNSVIAAIKRNYSVLIDETHCNYKRLCEAVEFYQELANVSFQIFDIDVDSAIERDKKRERTVGDQVIRRMYKGYLNLFDNNFDFSVRKKLPEIDKNITFNKDSELPNAVIFDIDGTLAHMNDKRGAFDWNKVYIDDVDEIVKETALIHKQAGYKIIVVTGRDGVSEEMTREWLELHEIPFDYLFTKPKDDYRKDVINKTEIYNDKIKNKFNVLAVYDDRNQVVKMWRELGLKCFQVKDGDF